MAGRVAQREADRAARLSAAQRALATAEASAGLRQRLTGATTLATAATAATTATTVARGQQGAAPAQAPSAAIPAELVLPLPAGLAPLFPAGGLRRGTAVQVSGSMSLLLALTAAAAGGTDDTWCAVVAMPDVGLAAAAEAGLDLDRTVVVPRPGPDAPAVLGALVDGFDVVVLGRCPALTDADRRGITTRIRTREAVLLAADVWPGAQTVLEVGKSAWFGVGDDGAGVLTGREATVTAYSRGVGTPRSVRVRMNADGGLERVASGRSRDVGARAPSDALEQQPELDWARAG